MLKFSSNLRIRRMKTTLQSQMRLNKILRSRQKVEIGNFWLVDLSCVKFLKLELKVVI